MLIYPKVRHSVGVLYLGVYAPACVPRTQEYFQQSANTHAANDQALKLKYAFLSIYMPVDTCICLHTVVVNLQA